MHRNWLVYGDGDPKGSLVGVELGLLNDQAIGVLGESDRWYPKQDQEFIEGIFYASFQNVGHEHLHAIRVGAVGAPGYAPGSLLIFADVAEIPPKRGSLVVAHEARGDFFRFVVIEHGSSTGDGLQIFGCVVAAFAVLDSRVGPVVPVR